VLNSPSQAITKIKADNSEPFRIIGWPWNLDGNYAAVYELEDIRSCSPLSNPEFINILRQFPGVEISSFWMIQVADPVKAQPVLNMLNVKYVMAPPDVNLGGKLAFRLVQRSDFGILENLEVWPRAFFVNHVVGIDSNEEFIKYLSQNSREPFASLAPNQIEKHPGLAQLKDNSPPAMIPATHYRLLPNATEFDIHASSAGVVCLTEGQARDFTATANHQPKPVLTVNRAFKGIYLDQPGDYHIQFTYRPRHWRLAVTLFFISWGGVLVLILIKLLRCKNVGNQMRPSVPLTNPN
jgi:hypothetical protein